MRARPAGCPSRRDAILAAPMSRNLVELVRRHHAVDAPTALDVLKAAMERSRRDHRRRPPRGRRARPGCPRRRSTASRRSTTTCSLPRGARHVRVCTGTACFAATGDAHVDALRDGLGLELGERARGRLASRSPRPSASASATPRPAVRDGDVDRRRPGVVERVLAGATPRRRPSRDWRSVLDEPVLTRPGDWSGLAHALARAHAREPARGGQGRRRPRPRRRRLPGRATSGSSPAASPGEQKFIVANGDEGDPGSYIDKYLMERNPELLLEGMALAGYAVGADHGFVLTPLGVPALQAGARRRDRRGARGRACSARTSSAAASPSTSRSSRAPAPTSSARRPRCWPACRGCAARSRRARRSRPQRGLLRHADGRQQRRDALQHPVHRRATAPRPTARSARARRRARKLVCFNERFAAPGRLRGAVRHADARAVRGRRRRPARRPRRSRRCRSAARSAGILPGVAARHAVRLRRARRRRLHGRPRRDRRLRRAHRHARRSRATCCTSAPTRAAASASRAGSACAARTRCSRPTRRSTARASRSCSRRSSSAACARTAAACRRRSAACSRTSPTSWGSPDAASRSTAPQVEVAAGTTVLEAIRARRRRRADAVLRRAPGAVRRLPRLPGRRRGRAAARSPACTTPVPRRAWRSTRSDATARRVADGGRRARPLRAARAARRRTPSSRRSRAELGVGEPRWPGADARRTTTTSATRTSRFQHELCISCGRCVRACDEVQGAFALTATGRGFDANITAGLDAGLPRLDLRLVRRLRRHLSDRRDHRDHPADA